MKINEKLIDKIFNLEIKLTNENEKYKLSSYENLIPMYDIRSERIYPINRKNLYNRLIISDYRFINEEIYEWINNLYNKYKSDKYKKNIEIMKNYNITILLNTSYKSLYKYSTQLGLQISICKRNSFNKFIDHLNPYYSKLELIKLGQNMKLIKKNMNLEDLINKDIHYDICLKISHNDISYKEIEEHHNYILDNNSISWICFYSYIGSYLFNDYLREDQPINDIIYNGLYKIVKCIENSPKLYETYNLYRFIWDDEYLRNLQIGDIYIDKGFISTTRDPFYTPGLLGHFGLILIKINIPKDMKGVGLFIENYSLFPKEEELLLPPYSKLQLISKDDKFKYYHINEKFEKIINKKYEFKLIGIDYEKLYEKLNKKIYTNYEYININNIKLQGLDRYHFIKNFLKNYSNENIIPLIINDRKYKIFYQWFNSTENSVYERLYFNKTSHGLLLTIIDEANGYPYMNIELAEQMCVNHLNKFYFGIKGDINVEHFLKIINQIGKIFNYKEVIIMHEYSSFIVFKDIYPDVPNTYLVSKFFNKTIYDYLKNGTKLYYDNKYIKYSIGYWYLDKFFNKKIDSSIIQHLPYELKKFKTYKEIYINVIENYFYYYNTIIYLFDNKLFEFDYFNYNIYVESNNNYDLEHLIQSKNNYNLIYRDSILRKN